MKILVVDVGGNNVKLLATGHEDVKKVPSGPDLTTNVYHGFEAARNPLPPAPSTPTDPWVTQPLILAGAPANRKLDTPALALARP